MTAIAIYELEVYKRTDELLNKIYPVLINYPKSEKFALCQEIKRNFYKLLTGISLGNSVNAIGFKVYPTHKLLRNDSKKRIKKKLNKMKNLLILERMTIEKAEQILNSWLGHASQGNSHNFIQKLLNKYDYIELKNKTLKIKEKVIIDARTRSVISER